MNDSKFIELLNLYLDHEISPADAALLEAEVARDPARREVYREYCRMQKACVVLTSQFGDAAPAEPAAFSPRPARRASSALWASGVLAAACAAIVISGRLHTARPESVPQGAGLAQSPVPAAPATGDFKPVFVARGLAKDPDTAAAGPLFPAADKGSQFAWMQEVNLAPIDRLSAGTLLLDTKPELRLATRLEVERPDSGVQAEKAAFQFQR